MQNSELGGMQNSRSLSRRPAPPCIVAEKKRTQTVECNMCLLSSLLCNQVKAECRRLFSECCLPRGQSFQYTLLGCPNMIECSSQVPAGAHSENLPYKPRSSSRRRAVNRMLSLNTSFFFFQTVTFFMKHKDEKQERGV